MESLTSLLLGAGTFSPHTQKILSLVNDNSTVLLSPAQKINGYIAIHDHDILQNLHYDKFREADVQQQQQQQQPLPLLSIESSTHHDRFRANHRDSAPNSKNVKTTYHEHSDNDKNQEIKNSINDKAKNTTLLPQPLIIWHGLGDSYNSESMNRVFDILRTVHPNLYIHSVYLDEDEEKDQQMSFISNMPQQLEQVCRQLANDTDLLQLIDSRGGVNIIGFSQGGLFARSLVESCETLLDKVNNLVTFGSPHNGIKDLPQCGARDWLCQQRNRLIKRQIWGSNIQNSVVFAQYFRDMQEYDKYLEYSRFLVFMNNELEFNKLYKTNLSKIGGKFAMIKFLKDTVVVPKETAWFSDEDPVSGEAVGLRDSMMYKYDWLGLKELDDKGKLEFLTIDDEHMRITEDFLQSVARSYL